MRREYPITRLHGYVIDRRRLDEAGGLLAAAPVVERGRLPGLNSDRADSIVGGALVVQAVMDRLQAPLLHVAGYGLREGIALRRVTETVASVNAVQRASIAAVGMRFTSWAPAPAASRASLTLRVLAAARSSLAPDELVAATTAAQLLDVGASIDYYRRYAHSARIVADANLDGFAHRTLALVSAAVMAVGEREASVKDFAPLLSTADVPVLEQLAAAVGLADALVRYGSADTLDVPLERTNGTVALAARVMDAWPLDAPARRAERAFGLRFELGTAQRAR
jgi:exopolyphosphatase/guanosine-5'-triphosphate,3'-diphosphate pyrophosphatase